MVETKRGQLFVLSGPSGVGKSTLVRELKARFLDRLKLSVSGTTRRPRPGERHGVDYYFLSPDEFTRHREAGDFLECCQVFGREHWYGTFHSQVTPSLVRGEWVLLEIDVEGTKSVLKSYPDAQTIFITLGSPGELERRLRARGTESKDTIEQRLHVAHHEMERAADYRYQVVNDTIEHAVTQLSDILTSTGGSSACSMH